MTDIENVIRGIKHESRNSGKCGHYCPEEYAAKCPYDPDGLCIIHWGADAIALLKAEPPKEQEPRVLTLEEVRNSEGKALVLERRLTFGDGKSSTWWSWVLYKNRVDECAVFADVAYVGNTFHQIDKYGKEWRCWSARPTDEQRKEVAWE